MSKVVKFRRPPEKIKERVFEVSLPARVYEHIESTDGKTSKRELREVSIPAVEVYVRGSDPSVACGRVARMLQKLMRLQELADEAAKDEEE